MVHLSVLIIGAGPIGLSCGIAAQEAGISYKIIDKGCLVNSLHGFPTDMTFFSSAEKLEIGNLPFTSLAVRPSKQEALEYYRRVANHFDLHIELYEAFESVKASNQARFQVTTSRGSYTCDFIVNATGFYDTPRPLRIPGEKLEKVSHYFTSAHHLFQQKVAIIGAANSAVDAALEAHRKGAEVTLLIRGDKISDHVKYWIKPDIEGRIAEGSIRVYYESKVLEITNRQVVFQQKEQRLQIDNDFVYAMTGFQPNFGLSQQLGIEVDPSSGLPDYAPETMETNATGVYLAGVVCGGLNTRQWYIENSRDHGEKIIRNIQKSYSFAAKKSTQNLQRFQ